MIIDILEDSIDIVNDSKLEQRILKIDLEYNEENQKLLDKYLIDDAKIDKNGYITNIYKREDEWKYVDELVLSYQKQFDENCTKEMYNESQEAMYALLNKFLPLFKKYITTIKTGYIDFKDGQIKLFVKQFMTEEHTVKALKQYKIKNVNKRDIHDAFDFIVQTYGAQPEEDILLDMQAILMHLAKKYKPIGKSFCCYVYNAFLFYLSREVKKYTGNLSNIEYRKAEFNEEYTITDDSIKQSPENIYEVDFIRSLSENMNGMPNQDWYLGKTCSEIFQDLTVLERNIIVKYYLDHWKDSQIADEYGIHYNTVNHKRRSALEKISKAIGADPKSIKRSRRSGKRAVLPI